MPPVNLLIKPASGLCNMHCDYCFYCDGITEEWCCFFVQNHFLVGISLDGTKVIHNRFRHMKSLKNKADGYVSEKQ